MTTPPTEETPMTWPVTMPLLTVTSVATLIPSGLPPAEYSVRLRPSVGTLIHESESVIRRDIVLAAVTNTGVISGTVPWLNHADLSPTGLHYHVTRIVNGAKHDEFDWAPTGVEAGGVVDLDTVVPLTGDPGAPVAVGPPGPVWTGGLTDLSNVTIGDSTEGDVLRLGPLGEWGPSTLDAADVGAATAAQGGLAGTATQPGDLGDSAALDVGTTTGTVAAGDDSRITGALPASDAPELIRDTMGSALVAGTNVTITPDDGADTITITASGGGGVTTALWIPSVAGNSVSAPDSAPLSVTGDLDIRVKVTPEAWGASKNLLLLQKTGSAGNLGYEMWFYGDVLYFRWSPDGTALTGTLSATVNGAGTLWLRATLDVDNGAGGHAWALLKSTDGSSWTQLGGATVAGTTVIFDSTASASVCLGGSTTNPTLIHQAEIRSGINGTIVGQWRGDTPHTRQRDAAGNIWTVNGTANAWQVV